MQRDRGSGVADSAGKTRVITVRGFCRKKKFGKKKKAWSVVQHSTGDMLKGEKDSRGFRLLWWKDMQGEPFISVLLSGEGEG